MILVANLSDLEVGIPIDFNYPLEETPNILVKLGQEALNGVGPDGDIVGYSQTLSAPGLCVCIHPEGLISELQHLLQSYWTSGILLLPRKRLRYGQWCESDRGLPPDLNHRLSSISILQLEIFMQRA